MSSIPVLGLERAGIVRMLKKRIKLGHLLNSQLVQSILAVAVKLGTGLASYILFAVTARLTGPTEFGLFSVLFSSAMLIGMVGSFGQQVFLVKEIPKAVASGDNQTERGAYQFSFTMTLVCATISAIVLIITSRVIVEESTLLAIVGGASLCFLFAVSQTTVGALRVLDRTLSGISTRDLLWRVLSVAAVVLFWYSQKRRGATEVSGGLAVLALAVALIPVIIIHVRTIWLRVYPGIVHQPATWRTREWLGTSAGLALVAVISSADLYVYTIALGVFLPASDAGGFFASMKTAELLNLFLMAVTLIIGPKMSELISRKERAALQKQCNSAIIMQGAPAIAAGAVVFAFAPVFLGFYEPSYVASATVLRLLVVGMLINALTGATGLLLQLAGLHWRHVVYQGGSLLLSVALLPLLIPWIGVLGAAVAFIIAKACWNILAIMAIRSRLGVDPSLLGLFSPVGGGLPAAIADLRSQLQPVKASVKGTR